MIKYALLSLTLLALIPFLTLDISAQSESKFTYYSYQHYADKIGSTDLITNDNIDILYHTLPTCHSHLQSVQSQKVRMEPNGDLVLSFTIYKHDFTSGKVYLTIKAGDDKSSISLVPTHKSTRGYYSNYDVTIPKSLISTNDNEKLTLSGRFFKTSDIIHNTGIFSNATEASSPLSHYTQNPKFKDSLIIMDLPDAKDNVAFESGTVNGIAGNVRTPTGDTVSLSESVLCKFGHMESSKFATIFNKDPTTTSNVLTGMQFNFDFEKKNRPDQLHWIVTESGGDSIRGNTDERITKITKKFTLTVPSSTSGTYNIVIFGTQDNNKKVIGVHSNSYTFTAPSNPLSIIPLPANFPNSVFGVLRFVQEPNANSAYLVHNSDDGHSYTHINYTHNPVDSRPIGDFFFQPSTSIKPNTMFQSNPNEISCNALVRTIQYALSHNLVPGLAIPDNLTPNGKNKLVAIGIDFYNDSDPNVQCSPDLESTTVTSVDSTGFEITISTNDPLRTDKEMRVTIYDKFDKTPYYFSPREDVTSAQPIPACNDDNYDKSDQTLKGIEMCYGINGDDMVIITKRLAGFYGATDSITS